MWFSRQEYWNGLSHPPSGGLPHPGIKSTSLMSPALAGGFLTTSATWEAMVRNNCPAEGDMKLKFKVAPWCPTLCDSMDYTVHGILRARTLEWAAFPFSRGSSRPRNRTRVSCIAGGFFTNWAIKEAQKEIWDGVMSEGNKLRNKHIFLLGISYPIK